MCVHPTGALEILHFSQVIYADTRVFFFGFSPHPWDMYCIFNCVWHVYSGHLPTDLFVYILQMLWKFRICPPSLPGHQGCVFRVFRIFSETITWMPGLFFSGFLHITGTCTAFLPVCEIFIRDIYPANYLCTSCRCSGHFAFFPGQLPRLPGLFYSGFPHIYLSQGCAENLKKNNLVSRSLSWEKCEISRGISGCTLIIWWVNVLNNYVTNIEKGSTCPSDVQKTQKK